MTIYDNQGIEQLGGITGGGGGGSPTGPAGGDLGGSYPNPTVSQTRGIRETAGPTTLVVGAINNGEALIRSGATVVSQAIIPVARAINTTAPLTGGGDLSADRTLGISDFVASGVGHARGAVPDPGASSGTTKFLREDATWAAPVFAPTSAQYVTLALDGALSAERVLVVGGGGSLTLADGGANGNVTLSRSALTGDVTASADSNATTIANDAVTLAKMANIATASILGRSTAGTGDPEVLGTAGLLAVSGGNVTTSIATARLAGRTTAGTGVLESISVDSTMSLSSLTLGVASASLTGRLKSIQVFASSASGTYTTPGGVTAIWVRCWGPGGGGGGVTGGVGSAAGGGGGAAGSYCEKYITSPSATYSYVVGAAGAGGAAGNNAGAAGTSTTFGTSLLTAPSGGGGDGMAAGSLKVSKGGIATVATGGDINGCGAPGATGICVSTSLACGGDGGSSAIGGGGRGHTTEQAGAVGIGPGAGGAGATSTGSSNRAGGNGTDGAIIVYEFS